MVIYQTESYTAQLIDVNDFEAALRALLAQEVFDVVVAQAAGWRTVVRLARAAGRPVYALGGITQKNAPRLLAAGLVGLAAVDGLRT